MKLEEEAKEDRVPTLSEKVVIDTSVIEMQALAENEQEFLQLET